MSHETQEPGSIPEGPPATDEESGPPADKSRNIQHLKPTIWTVLDETLSCQFGRYDDENTARLEAERRTSLARHAHSVVRAEVREDERRLTTASCEICHEPVPAFDDIVLRVGDILACAKKDCRRAATTKVSAGHVAVYSTRR